MVKIENQSNKLINIGFDSSVPTDAIIAVIPSGSNPIKRKVDQARELNLLIDVTFGRKTRSVIFTKSNYVILSAISSETITKRFNESISDIA